MGKRTSDVVMGMLSDAGSVTRPVVAAPPAPAASAPVTPVTESVRPAAPLAPARSAGVPAPTVTDSDASGAPRTLRLRPAAAGQLRSAWLEAKRDDVLLTAQDFASDLVEEALASRQRRRRSASPA